MAQWLDYRVRVTISDARMLVGQLLSDAETAVEWCSFVVPV